MDDGFDILLAYTEPNFNLKEGRFGTRRILSVSLTRQKIINVCAADSYVLFIQ
jgi:hypothetical protein